MLNIEAPKTWRKKGKRGQIYFLFFCRPSPRISIFYLFPLKIGDIFLDRIEANADKIDNLIGIPILLMIAFGFYLFQGLAGLVYLEFDYIYTMSGNWMLRSIRPLLVTSSAVKGIPREARYVYTTEA